MEVDGIWRAGRQPWADATPELRKLEARTIEANTVERRGAFIDDHRS
jgi:hypothetical protein